MRGHDSPARLLRQLHSVNGLRHGADLVHLQQQRVAGPHLGSLLDANGVGHGQIISHDLNVLANRLSERGPAFPIILGRETHLQISTEIGSLLPTYLIESIFDRFNGEFTAEIFVEVCQLGSGESGLGGARRAGLLGEVVLAVDVEL